MHVCVCVSTGDQASDGDSELMYQSGVAAVADTPGQNHTPRGTPFGSDADIQAFIH